MIQFDEHIFQMGGPTTNQKRSTIQLPRVYEKSVRAFLFEQSDVPWGAVGTKLEMLAEQGRFVGIKLR